MNVPNTPNPNEVVQQAGDVVVDIGNAAQQGAGVAATAVQQGAGVAANAAIAGGQQVGQTVHAAVNSDEAKQAGAALRQGAVTTANAAVAGGQQVVAGVTAAANSEEAAAAMNAARQAGGAVIAGFNSIPVPEMNFDADTAKKTMGAASAAIGAFFVDVMQLEIVRDFFQFLGTMVDNIKMPSGFRAFFGNVASLLSVSFGYLLEFVKSITAVHWYFIFAVGAFIPWIMLIFFMRRDLNLDLRFAATREA